MCAHSETRARHQRHRLLCSKSSQRPGAPDVGSGVKIPKVVGDTYGAGSGVVLIECSRDISLLNPWEGLEIKQEMQRQAF